LKRYAALTVALGLGAGMCGLTQAATVRRVRTTDFAGVTLFGKLHGTRGQDVGRDVDLDIYRINKSGTFNGNITDGISDFKVSRGLLTPAGRLAVTGTFRENNGKGYIGKGTIRLDGKLNAAGDAFEGQYIHVLRIKDGETMLFNINECGRFIVHYSGFATK